MEHSPQIRAWQRARANQEREKKWILQVMREFERRTTPQRNGNNRSQDAPPSSCPLRPSATVAASLGGGLTSHTPVAAPSSTSTPPTPTPTVAAARGPDRQQPSVLPNPLRTAPSPSSGKSIRRRRDEGVVHHTSPRSAPAGKAAGGYNLLWRVGKTHEETANTTSAAATVLGSSYGSSSTGTVSTAITRGRAVAEWSPSSCGAHSPVDLRSAGRGGEGRGLGLGSPPAGVVLRFGDEGKGKEEEDDDDDDSPPRPRAFWREAWLRGSEGEGSCALDCPRRGCLGLHVVAGDDCCSSTHNERAAGGRVGMARRSCCCRNDSSVGDERDCCQGGSSGDKGWRPRRCCSNKSHFRDARVKKAFCDGNSGNYTDRRASSPRPAKCRCLSAADAEQSRHGGEEDESRGQLTTTATTSDSVVGCGEGRNSRVSGDGVTAVGLVFLAAVTVAAFSAGTLVGPPPRQPLPPSPPSASTPEYAPLHPPRQTYKLTLRQGTPDRRIGPGSATGVSSIEQAPPAAAGGGGGSCSDVVTEKRGGEVDGVSRVEAEATAASARADHSAPMSISGGKENARPKDARVVVESEVNECERACAQAAASCALDGAPGSETVSLACCAHPQAPAAAAVGQELGRQHRPPSGPVDVEGGSRSQSGTAAASSSPGGTIAGPGSSGHGAVHTEANPSSRSPGAWAAAARADAVASRGGKSFRRRTAERITHAAAGSTLATFAQTLGWAEKSLTDFSAGGSDESDERAIALARRAAMSKSAARSACDALAWGKAALAAGAGPAPQGDDGVCDNTGSVWEDSEGGPRDDALPMTKIDDPPGGGYGQAAERAADETAAAVVAGDAKILVSAEDSGPAGYVGLAPSSSPSIATTLAETNIGHGQGTPPLGPRCRGLVLSGNDIQISWAGRYVPVRAVDGDGGDARQVPKAAASSTQRAQPQTPYYYCLVPSSASSSSDSAVPEREERALREEAGKRGEEPPPPPLLPDALDKDAPLSEGPPADRSETLAGAAGRQPPTRSATTGTQSETELGGSPITLAPRGTAPVKTEVANPRVTLPAVSKAGAAAAAAAEAAAAPGSGLGLQEVTAGRVLCLYWADVAGGGRWVLDDDLRLSNGVLGVTKGSVPAAADLAFPSRGRPRRFPRPSGGDEVGGATASNREASEVEEVDLDRDDEPTPGVEDGADGAVVWNEEEGAGGRATQEWREGPSTWLLDSPRRQDWVEAKNVFVECERV
eukprot:g13118.t1